MLRSRRNYFLSTLYVQEPPLKFRLVLCCTDRLCGLVVRVSSYRSRGPADFLRSRGSGTGSTQPHEGKWDSYLEEIVAAPVKRTETNDWGDPLR
jgi:hypothetical protein